VGLLQGALQGFFTGGSYRAYSQLKEGGWSRGIKAAKTLKFLISSRFTISVNYSLASLLLRLKESLNIAI
jgi:hypothetical protein